MEYWFLLIILFVWLLIRNVSKALIRIQKKQIHQENFIRDIWRMQMFEHYKKNPKLSDEKITELIDKRQSENTNDDFDRDELFEII